MKRYIGWLVLLSAIVTICKGQDSIVRNIPRPPDLRDSWSFFAVTESGQIVYMGRHTDVEFNAEFPKETYRTQGYITVLRQKSLHHIESVWTGAVVVEKHVYHTNALGAPIDVTTPIHTHISYITNVVVTTNYIPLIAK